MIPDEFSCGVRATVNYLVTRDTGVTFNLTWVALNSGSSRSTIVSGIPGEGSAEANLVRAPGEDKVLLKW